MFARARRLASCLRIILEEEEEEEEEQEEEQEEKNKRVYQFLEYDAWLDIKYQWQSHVTHLHASEILTTYSRAVQSVKSGKLNYRSFLFLLYLGARHIDYIIIG